MAGRHQHKVLTNVYSKEHLMEQGKKNMVAWNESNHEGVNWMRFSNALANHLDNGKDFHTDDHDVQGMKKMLEHYTALKELHKQSMVPHVRAAMTKLHSESTDTTKGLMDHVKDAYVHLDANGGHVWAEKVSTLNHINKQINHLSSRLEKLGQNS